MRIGVKFGIGRKIKKEWLKCYGECLEIDKKKNYKVRLEKLKIIEGEKKL